MNHSAEMNPVPGRGTRLTDGRPQRDYAELVSARPEISIVSTLYRSRPFLETFLRECVEVLQRLGCRHYEIVLVNDGSPDDSLAYALSCAANVPGLVVVDLSRNFGHHYAAQAGLRLCRGELVFL